MDAGLFNYKLVECDLETRRLPGQMNYLAVLNTARGQKRRVPEIITSVNLPFNPNKFHFNKVKREEILMTLCPDAERQGGEPSKPGRHQVIINASPFTFGHCLLVPDVADCINQRMTLTATRLAIEMMLLSKHPGFRIGFNGLCALASVNHQHVHGWYLHHTLRLEHCSATPLAAPCHLTEDLPGEGFVFQLHGTTVGQLAGAVHAVTSYLQDRDVAHNLFISRGVVFGEPADSSHRTVRVFVWPRIHFIGEKLIPGTAVSSAFNVAVAELAGHVPIYFDDGFDELTEETIIRTIKASMLPQPQFDKICKDIKSLLSC